MNPVAIIDYGLCNLGSIRRACEECGGDSTIVSDPHAIDVADRVIIPGVGAFPDAMAALESSGNAEALRRAAARGVPMLGICPTNACFITGVFNKGLCCMFTLRVTAARGSLAGFYPWRIRRCATRSLTHCLCRTNTSGCI